MTRQVLRITASNTAEVLDLDAPEGSLKVLQNAVGGRIEFVQINPDAQMVVDEEFLYSGKDQNMFGSRIVHRLSGGRQTVVLGDVVLTGGVDSQGDVLALAPDRFRSYCFLAGVALPTEVR